jgi:hypothetical protein
VDAEREAAQVPGRAHRLADADEPAERARQQREAAKADRPGSGEHLPCQRPAHDGVLDLVAVDEHRRM